MSGYLAHSHDGSAALEELDGQSIGGTTLRLMAIAATGFAMFLALNVRAEQTINEISKSPIVAEVLAVHDRLADAARTSDVAVFKELLSEDVVVNAPNNKIYHRDDLISLFQSGVVAYRSTETIVEYADELGNVVVIMGRESTVLESAPKGSPWGPGATLHRRFTNIYRKEDGNWRLNLSIKLRVSIAVDTCCVP
jgi:ketosteroid isomerase-like protein